MGCGFITFKNYTKYKQFRKLHKDSYNKKNILINQVLSKLRISISKLKIGRLNRKTHPLRVSPSNFRNIFGPDFRIYTAVEPEHVNFDFSTKKDSSLLKKALFIILAIVLLPITAYHFNF